MRRASFQHSYFCLTHFRMQPRMADFLIPSTGSGPIYGVNKQFLVNSLVFSLPQMTQCSGTNIRVTLLYSERTLNSSRHSHNSYWCSVMFCPYGAHYFHIIYSRALKDGVHFGQEIIVVSIEMLSWSFSSMSLFWFRIRQQTRSYLQVYPIRVLFEMPLYAIM